MLIRMFEWAKFRNSTEIPTGPGYVPVDVYDCQLKEDTSIIAPTVIIRFSDQTKLKQYGYAYLDDFNRWYFIKNYTFNKTRWLIDLEVDPLASFREEIKNTYGYVLRADRWPETYPDDAKGYFIDSLYPVSTQAAITSFDIDSPFTAQFRDGSIVIGVIGAADANTVSALGAISYYLIDVRTFQFLCYALLSQEASYTGVNGDIMDPNLLRCIFNPLQYFASVIWFPFNFSGDYGIIENMVASQSLTKVSSIHYGWWQITGLGNTGMNCYRIESNKGFMSFSQQIQLYHHPEYNEDRKYVDYAPYRRVNFYAYPFGVIPVDLSMIIDNSFGYRFIVDLFTGHAVMDVGAIQKDLENDFVAFSPLQRVETQFGFEVPIAQMGTDVIKANADIVTSAANVVNDAIHLNLAGMVSTAATGISDAIHNSAPQLMSRGTMGSVSLFNTIKWGVVEYFYQQAAYANTVYGRPVCYGCNLYECFGGYVQVARSWFRSLTATTPEREAIDEALENGFFLL